MSIENKQEPMSGLSNEPIPDLHVPQTEVPQIGDHRLSTLGLCGRSSSGRSDLMITIVVLTLFNSCSDSVIDSGCGSSSRVSDA